MDGFGTVSHRILTEFAKKEWHENIAMCLRYYECLDLRTRLLAAGNQARNGGSVEEGVVGEYNGRKALKEVTLWSNYQNYVIFSNKEDK